MHVELTLIRHAEAARGPGADRADPALSERGSRQARCLAERAARWKPPTAVLVSPAARARQTADPLCAALNVSPTVATWLEEVRMPEGGSLDVARERVDERLGQAAWSAFRAGVVRGVLGALAQAGAAPAGEAAADAPPELWQLGGGDARIVLVGHGMAHAVALEWLLGVASVPWAGYRFQFAHAAFARVQAFPLKGDWVFGLVRYNDTDHLPRALKTY